MDKERTYIAIDLKSFYASVECVERGLDPLTTNLVVADKSRTEKTICLAVTPSLKQYGIGGRARLFEVVQRVRQVNNERRKKAPYWQLTGESADDNELKAHPELAVTYHVAPPRMAYYIDYSARIFSIYMKYIAPEDIHVYSVDEVFMDVTNYLGTYKITAHELARRMIGHVLRETGITATAGIGPNLYLCKVAMDIVAKHIPADKDGVRIAELDEMSYRRQLWNHRPLTDFWRVGRGIARKLEACGMQTMGDVARCSLTQEGLLYKLFGVNAELLIDHAWGWEPCTMKAIKAYRPKSNSFSSGQVLSEAYPFEKARIVLWVIDAVPTLEELNDIKERCGGKSLIIIQNKIDKQSDVISLPEETNNSPVLPHYSKMGKDTCYPILPISAKSGQGIEALEQSIFQAVHLPTITDSDIIITNARHYDALQRAHAHLTRIIDGLHTQLSSDLLAEDLRLTLDTLAEITGGQITTNEILGNIFKNFCVGK